MINPHDLLEEFSFQGTWWLPEVPETKVSGTLSFSPDTGVALALESRLERHHLTDPPWTPAAHREERQWGKMFGPPLILGRHDSGPLCTVFGVDLNALTTGLAGAARVEYRGTALVLGSHVAAADRPISEVANLRFTYLEEWIGNNPFSSAPLEPANQDAGFTITYRYPEKFVAQLPKHELCLEIVPGCDELSDRAAYGFSLYHTETFRLEAARPKCAEEWLRIAGEIRRLLTVLMDRPAYCKRIDLEGAVLQLGGGESARTPVTLYTPSPHRRLSKSAWRHKMPFPFERVRDRFGSMLSAWLDKAQSLRSVYELFETVFFGAPMTTQIGLLTLTQAFETFHRIEIGGTYTDHVTFEQHRQSLTTAIPAGVTDDHRAALRNRIKFGNNYSLRKRIDTALKSFGPAASVIISREPGRFGGRIADTRNYLTHHDEENKGDVIPPEDLLPATEKFRYFFTVLFLGTLGIPADEALNAMQTRDEIAAILRLDCL